MLTVANILRFRARSTPKQIAFTTLDSKGKEYSSITFEKLNARAEKVAHNIKEKSNVQKGSMVALIYRYSEIIDYVIALFGCFYANIVAVPIVTTSVSIRDECTEILFILEHCDIHLALTTESNLKSLSKDFTTSTGAGLPKIEWWKTNEFGSYHPKKKGVEEIIEIHPNELAYIEYTKSPSGELKGVLLNHSSVLGNCLNIKSAIDIKSSDVLACGIEARNGPGLGLGVFQAICSGSHTIFLPEGSWEIPNLWCNIITRFKGF